MELPVVESTSDGVAFGLRVRAGAGRTGIKGVHDGCLKIDVKAPPEDGRANAEILKTVAGWFGIATECVKITAGATSKTKRIRLTGVSDSNAGEVFQKLLTSTKR